MKLIEIPTVKHGMILLNPDKVAYVSRGRYKKDTFSTTSVAACYIHLTNSEILCYLGEPEFIKEIFRSKNVL